MSPSQNSTADRNARRLRSAASAVLMIRPAAFRCNEVTRPTNRFQSWRGDDEPDAIAAAAVREFDACVAALAGRGVDVRVFPGRTMTSLPDEVFPNNWFSTHPDGTAVLYPMMAWNRREERRRDVLDQLQQQADGFRIDRVIDLSGLEAKNCFLEGTGSLVLDHASRLAYACLSPRTHADALREFARSVDYDVIAFSGQDVAGHAIYHTNVMMSLGEDFALVCLEAIPAIDERFRLQKRLEQSGRELIEIGLGQLSAFVGNLLQLRAGKNRLIALSRSARAALNDRQLEALGRHGELLAIDVGTIERHGGGSVRCMLAEIFLPGKKQLAGADAD